MAGTSDRRLVERALKRGFSLAETIIASFLVSLVTLAIFNLFPSSAMMVKRGEMALIADSLAHNQLEELRNQPFESLTVGSVATPEPVTNNGVEYSLQAEILAHPGSDPDALKIARVTVTWSHARKDYSAVGEAWLSSVRP